jgi:hypothetical protein
MKIYVLTFIYLMSGLLLSTSAMARLAPVTAPSSGGMTPFTAQSAPQHISSCQAGQTYIQSYCSQNPAMVNAQNAAGNANIPSQSQRGAGEAVANSQAVANQGLRATGAVRRACRAANSACSEHCSREAQEHVDRANASSDPATQQAEMQQHDQKVQIRNQCHQEFAAVESQAQGLQANLAEILQALAQIAQALGMGEGNDSMELANNEEEEDKCEGEFAHLLIECRGQSDPKGTRAGLSGMASLTQPGGGSGTIFDGSQQGEPGGEDKGRGNGGAAGNSPFTGAGFGGGGGFGGTNPGTSNGSGESGEGLDTDIHKGFLSGGGGGGGGSGGGARRGGGFRATPPLGAAANGVDKAELQKKLNKFSGAAKRSPASVGGTNGPFESNWVIIKKAYKKNSSSMFHQQ